MQLHHKKIQIKKAPLHQHIFSLLRVHPKEPFSLLQRCLYFFFACSFELERKTETIGSRCHLYRTRPIKHVHSSTWWIQGTTFSPIKLLTLPLLFFLAQTEQGKESDQNGTLTPKPRTQPWKTKDIHTST